MDESGLAEPFAGGPPRIRYPELHMKAVVRCDQPGHTISPLIYGVADFQVAPELNLGALRLGGNGMSCFNWKKSCPNVLAIERGEQSICLGRRTDRDAHALGEARRIEKTHKNSVTLEVCIHGGSVS